MGVPSARPGAPVPRNGVTTRVRDCGHEQGWPCGRALALDIPTLHCGQGIPYVVVMTLAGSSRWRSRSRPA